MGIFLALQNSILAPVCDRLFDEEKRALNAPFTSEELDGTVQIMKKLKCPGPDGAPVEFFQTMWATVGPLILCVLNQGLNNEEFGAAFTHGLIVLLPKKLDQQLLTNKCPITLLNVVYKIGAKVMHRRITPILQRIISPQQFAFLPGRNIHHSLVLMGEMLHQASIFGEEHMLLKMDVVKAFDKLKWPFLMALLEKAGFIGRLTKFVNASFAHASSSILLNGCPTQSIRLRRSVRQGFPLSPLLFILAYDVLSLHTQIALSNGRIEGGHLPTLGHQVCLTCTRITRTSLSRPSSATSWN